MAKPWRMVVLHVGAWITLGLLWSGRLDRPGALDRAGLEQPGRRRRDAWKRSPCDWPASCEVWPRNEVESRPKNNLRVETVGVTLVALSPSRAAKVTPTMRRARKQSMSPSAAFSSDVFRIYAGVVLGLLVVGGLLIATLRWGLHRNVSHAWQSYTSWLVMAPLVVLGIFAGRVPLIVLLTLLAVFAFKEYARATGLYRDWLMTGVVYLGIRCHGPGFRDGRSALGTCPAGTACLPFCPAYVIAAILLIPILRNRCRRPTPGHRPGDSGVPLHRLDVRPSGVPGQRQGCLRLSCSI